ncbi:MAG: HAD-IC family P-type ATPase [Micropruina sp.]|uniref:HAD-IC family P-type ATPase n=1 Tax=Micropruina sp. TaxID=2737536 RepID=UPI0039E4E1AD
MTAQTRPADPGLTAAEVAERIQRGQRNDLPPRSGRTRADIVRANVFTRINGILAALLICVLATGSWINGAFGLLIFANSAIGIIQELRAKKTLDSLAVVGEARPRIRRDGVGREYAREEIVLDDLIEVGPGDQIVVDGTVVEADYLEVDESLLTGESDPEPKAPGAEVLSGSFVVSGAGAYRATRVGATSYAAQLTAEAAKFTLVKSELTRGINQILKVITWVLVPVGAATIWVQLSQAGDDWRRAVLAMAGALVPMVPEGLILLTAVAFALGVVRLGQRKCLVQELPAIEGLARVDVVCADKTGTLTENGMTFGELRVLDGVPPAEVEDGLRQLAASDARPNVSMQTIAAALVPADVRWPVLAKAPFTSAKKWSGATFEASANASVSWVIGAPDVLAAPGSAAASEADQLAAQGLRVLLVGTAELPVDDPGAPGAVSPKALVVLNQRIRPDAADTLAFFADQGVGLKVISGDNAASVGAVTRSLGVVSDHAVDARMLPADPQAFADAVEHTDVFGRVTPHQKRAMVGALQQHGHTVAMTGDGVNDVLALKDADLGVAMGSGSAATRAVAKIVLLDDRFATLPHVVAEGRRVIGNIERVANLFLTKTIYSALLALFVVLWRVPFPYLPIHVTITGWFTIGIPAFLLSLAPNNERARPGFVERVLRLGVPAGVIVAVATFVTYLLVLPESGTDVVAMRQATTATLACVIVAATWVLAVVARPYQWWKVALVLVSGLAYLLIFSWPFTQSLFMLDVSDALAMTTGLISGLIGAALIELTWWIRGAMFNEPRVFWKSRIEDV